MPHVSETREIRVGEAGSRKWVLEGNSLALFGVGLHDFRLAPKRLAGRGAAICTGTISGFAVAVGGAANGAASGSAGQHAADGSLRASTSSHATGRAANGQAAGKDSRQ